jgi:HAE1 family hydrophobic/amphiphilic exporter-1/multidrug efflux pump
MSLGAASTSRIGMGSCYCRNYLFFSSNFICYAILCGLEEKHYPEFEHIEEYENESK